MSLHISGKREARVADSFRTRSDEKNRRFVLCTIKGAK
jgi:hypothetical protein